MKLTKTKVIQALKDIYAEEHGYAGREYMRINLDDFYDWLNYYPDMTKVVADKFGVSQADIDKLLE